MNETNNTTTFVTAAVRTAAVRAAVRADILTVEQATRADAYLVLKAWIKANADA